MSPGLLILLLAVVAAVAFGLHRRRVDGRFAAAVQNPPVVEVRGAPATNPPVVEVRGAPATSLETPAATARGTSPWAAVLASLPAAELGERATLVQFSSAFCAPCRATRVLLTDVAAQVGGVSHVEVDAEEQLDLVRRLGVRRTPTTLILDPAGEEIARAAGAPRREQVLAALPPSAKEPR